MFSIATHSFRRTAREILLIALRHVFLPINAIIFSVVLLLVLFGEIREGIFLGALVLFNILLGFGQDVRAWLLLERLQLLTALTITRIDAKGNEESISLEEISKGDCITLSLGDQMPCDGVVVSGKNLEVSEGLVTGESDSFPRGEGVFVLAGSVVTAGTGVVRVETSFEESRMAKMARGLKRYSAHPSPIQHSITIIVRFTVYVLLAIAVFIVVRGILTHEAAIRVVEQIGALASVLVPQGLVVATTLLFTYGAGHFFNRHVLLQEVNATEKFGRIKNLCMDKTGTLTENALTVERFNVPHEEDMATAREFSALYARHSGDLSQTIKAIGEYLAPAPGYPVREALPFSSWRRYGGIALMHPAHTIVLVGGPEIFLPHLRDDSERAWLSAQSRKAVQFGKRVLCVARTQGAHVPNTLAETDLSVIGLFVLSNVLREGVRDAVNFFQDRGVTIRIISGDHPDTIRHVALAAGIAHADTLITGTEMKAWNTSDYARNVVRYSLFARVEPEQKERIIDALKLDGFTAMIGDGANDALSVKKADLGIALFDGATAARQIAAVVLMRNSFAELPAGVQLADSMIENIEIFASLFLNQTFLEFLFFIMLTLVGISFPLTPLHITFINYFTVGFSGVLISWWAISPSRRTIPPGSRSFLKRVVPLPLILSCIQIFAVIGIWVLGRAYLPNDSLPSLLAIGIAALGFLFLMFTSEVHSNGLSRARRMSLYLFGAIEAALLFAAFRTPLVLTFFGLATPSRAGVMLTLFVVALCGVIQYAVMKLYFRKSESYGTQQNLDIAKMPS